MKLHTANSTEIIDLTLYGTFELCTDRETTRKEEKTCETCDPSFQPKRLEDILVN